MENQEAMQKTKSRAKYEYIVILVVVVAVLAVAVGIYAARGKASKGQILMSELEQMRSAVMTYKTLNKANPPELSILTKSTYEFSPGESPRPYVTAIKSGEKGELLDPFGTPYLYDSKNGWVKSGTKGFEDW